MDPKRIVHRIRFCSQSSFLQWQDSMRAREERPFEIAQIVLHLPSERRAREIAIEDLQTFYGRGKKPGKIVGALQRTLRKLTTKHFVHRDDSVWSVKMDKVFHHERRFPNENPSQSMRIQSCQVYKKARTGSLPEIRDLVWRLFLFQSSNQSNHFLIWRLVPHEASKENNKQQRLDEQYELLEFISERWRWIHWE